MLFPRFEKHNDISVNNYIILQRKNNKNRIRFNIQFIFITLCSADMAQIRFSHTYVQIKLTMEYEKHEIGLCAAMRYV